MKGEGKGLPNEMRKGVAGKKNSKEGKERRG